MPAKLQVWLVIDLERSDIVKIAEDAVVDGTIELLAVGKRPGHYRAFLNLVRHADLWNTAHEDYGKINLPTLLIYGDKDWSNEEERERTRRGIPGVRMETIEGGGHFLSLDRPQELIGHIKDFSSPSSR